MDVDDIYSDVDSEGFIDDMRSFGVGQALPLDVSIPTSHADPARRSLVSSGLLNET